MRKRGFIDKLSQLNQEGFFIANKPWYCVKPVYVISERQFQEEICLSEILL